MARPDCITDSAAAAIAYVRDKNHAQARETLLGLQQEFPENRLFAKELARLDKIASR